MVHQINFFIKKNKNKFINVNFCNNVTLIGLSLINSYYLDKKKKKTFKNFYISSFITYYLRFIWRGKAFRIRFFKKSNKITFNFNHSHWYKLIFKKSYIRVFRLKRQNYLITYSSRFDKSIISNIINSIRPYNKYTKRGIRLKKYFFKQRFGKISQVNSILHSF